MPTRGLPRSGRCLWDVRAVQRIADLQAKRVACAEPARNRAASDDGVPQLGRILRGAAELDARLARVARSADHDLDPVQLTHPVREGRRGGELQPRQSPRPLHRDEPVVVGCVTNLGAPRLPILEELEDRVAIRGVDDEQVLAVAQAVRDQVVDDPAVLVGEERVLGLSVVDLGEIVREHLLEECQRASARRPGARPYERRRRLHSPSGPRGARG